MTRPTLAVTTWQESVRTVFFRPTHWLWIELATLVGLFGVSKRVDGVEPWVWVLIGVAVVVVGIVGSAHASIREKERALIAYQLELEDAYERDPKVMLARQLCETACQISATQALSAGDVLLLLAVEIGNPVGDDYLRGHLEHLVGATEAGASCAVETLMPELCGLGLVVYEPEPGQYVIQSQGTALLPFIRERIRLNRTAKDSP